MAPVARYTVLRILVFFGCVCLGYLCGLRSFLLLIVAALASLVVLMVPVFVWLLLAEGGEDQEGAP